MTVNRLDIVHYIVTETLARHLPARPRTEIEALARPMLQPIHEMLGGDRYYIPAQSPALAEERRRAVVHDGMTSMPTPEIQQRHSVSRTTIYRLLKRQ